jgi:hypothetical protein
LSRDLQSSLFYSAIEICFHFQWLVNSLLYCGEPKSFYSRGKNLPPYFPSVVYSHIHTEYLSLSLSLSLSFSLHLSYCFCYFSLSVCLTNHTLSLYFFSEFLSLSLFLSCSLSVSLTFIRSRAGELVFVLGIYLMDINIQ